MATSEGTPTELERRPGSVILNSTDERGHYIYFNTLYQAAFKEGQNKWRDIGIALNLDPNDISTIENQSKPEDCFRQMLLKWFQVNEECYLSTFIEALRASNVELVSLIPRVEEAIISTHTQETQNTEVSRTRPRKRGPSETSLSEMEPNKRRPSERLSGQVRSDGGIDVEINDFKKRFQELKEATLNELTAEDCTVSVSIFRQAFLLLPDSIANENESLVLSKYSIFEKAESIESILAHVSYYLSYMYIDYSLLEYIINKFCSERLKEDMRDYTQDMKEFKARTTISNALSYLPKPKLSNRKNLPENFSELIVEFDVDINVDTLAKLDELRQIHADEFKLSHLAFFLFKFKKRSLLVTWLVPTSLETTIIDKIQKTNIEFFSSNNILELSLGGKQLYPFKKEIDKTETSSDKFPEVTAKPGELLAPRHLPCDTDTLGLSKPSLTQVDPSASVSITESRVLTQYARSMLLQDQYTPYTRSRSDDVFLAAPYFHSKDIGDSRVHTIGESITGSPHSEYPYQETKIGSKPTVDTETAKPHHSSKYSDPDPRHRETANKISTLIESIPDCHGLAIMMQLDYYIELNNMSEILSSTCRFAVYNPPVDPISWQVSLSMRSTMESVHLVELKHCPIVVVASGEKISHHYMSTDHFVINIKDDIVEPLFSPAAPHLADNPKIFLFIARYYYDISSIQTIFPSTGGNYIVGVIICYRDTDSVTSTILRALESPQESVQEIFKYLDRKINQLPYGHMTVIDHLKEPVYLHPDAPQGTYSGPGPTKKLPVSEQLEEVTSTVEKLNINEYKN